MNIKKLCTIILAGMVIISTIFFNAGEVKVLAAPLSGWCMASGNWHYYSKGNVQKDCWEKDSYGWCYIGSDGCWVNHEYIAKDSLGYCVIGSNGYWTGDRVLTEGMSISQVAENAASIVYVESSGGQLLNPACASGCIVSADGTVITNYHVINGAENVKVTLQNGTTYEASGVLGYNKDLDIAILKIKGASNLRAVNIGDSDSIVVGQDIVTIGSPGGYMGTVSDGIISGLHRMNFNLRQAEDIQISAPITNGSSGGGLFDMNGQLIGITYAGNMGNGNLNFAIPIDQVKPYLQVKTLTSFSQLNLQ